MLPPDVGEEVIMSQASVASRVEENVEREQEELCVVCFRRVEIYSVGECDHPVCYECSTRMRVLCARNECPICRKDMSKVGGGVTYQGISVYLYMYVCQCLIAFADAFHDDFRLTGTFIFNVLNLCHCQLSCVGLLGSSVFNFRVFCGKFST